MASSKLRTRSMARCQLSCISTEMPVANDAAIAITGLPPNAAIHFARRWAGRLCIQETERHISLAHPCSELYPGRAAAAKESGHRSFSIRQARVRVEDGIHSTEPA